MLDRQPPSEELRVVASPRCHAIAYQQRAFGGSGPVRAIAAIVDLEPVSGPLAEAAELLESDKVTEAADAASKAFHAALVRVQSPLRAQRRGFPVRSFRGLFARALGRSYPSPFADAERQLDDVLHTLAGHLFDHEPWILAAGLGMRPAELAELERVLGAPLYDNLANAPVVRRKDVVLSRELVGSALLQTADVIYRLWQGGALARPPEPETLVGP